MVADPDAEAPFDCLVIETDVELLRELLPTLAERESDILSSRYGLKDGTPRTLEDIGARWGVTRERIGQIQEEAQRGLRAKMEKRDRPSAEQEGGPRGSRVRRRAAGVEKLRPDAAPSDTRPARRVVVAMVWVGE